VPDKTRCLTGTTNHKYKEHHPSHIKTRIIGQQMTENDTFLKSSKH